MGIDFLGPVSVRWQDKSIVPTAGKPRQLLVLLALHCGSTVPVSTLMEELWGDAIPRSGSTTLQTYVLQLRRLITDSLPAGSPQTAKELLATHFNGYQLAVDPDWFDLREFERTAARGDAALEAGDAEGASRSLSQALALWRGPAIMDVPAGRVLAMEVIGMEEARMRVLERRIIADMSLGKHGMLIPELCMLVAQHPMHETFSGLLMIAFQRSGASWRALQVFQQLRKTLIEELGVEPSSRLQRLHQAVLCNTSNLSLQSFSLA
ncbi:BTAD domain-containing putative transcriptional regulator [Streptomyces sp. NPDC048723]|uniref:AfsR/SARP family transcriptional regulator n=1 Tax=unclassified Streptomyces TaxID=2593676 RepID=UPI00356AC330